MKVNEKIAISTSKALLVPYEAHHVLTYHDWMQDPAIQEATASEPMTLEEEFENQLSWRTSHDKLTFIVCEPLSNGESVVTAQGDDAPEKMRGDINFFLYLDDNDDEEGEEEEVAAAGARGESSNTIRLRGEVDVMIARTQHRGKGLGEAAVRSMLGYIRRHLSDVLDEYAKGEGLLLLDGGKAAAAAAKVQLVGLMAKIKEDNAGSRALFGKLGFRQEGEANYFGEVKMVMGWGEGAGAGAGAGIEEGLGYRELEYVM
ncbi:hypothetical protein BBK36DRAFT_1156046 [Trichoderma citrinoviride]|uniref:N-acetyltransferase domain-containing protein n=1 Tax=Trichoderma citrinoviride TaxID=58853 RepID=A0A2T4BJI6_9HYPO|nr:hypothetical protein BBK36DRAFT_1156046 [Trichoderma citrinoviride]PTB69473.1 hypothetical protein BBK36DRAFT_1156046 [Trichoderma citrinoviride]